jgi:hypothetical protein
MCSLLISGEDTVLPSVLKEQLFYSQDHESNCAELLLPLPLQNSSAFELEQGSLAATCLRNSPSEDGPAYSAIHGRAYQLCRSSGPD